MTELDDAKYIALTTFKRDGSAVMTPVWVVPSGTGYRVVTGKYKRIRNNPEVTIAACSASGATRPGATAYRGTARILNDEEPRAAALAVRERYGLIGRLVPSLYDIRARLTRRPFGPPVSLEITLDKAHQADEAA